jgi:hypothetical protein
MATVKQATIPASRQRSSATTLAAILYCWFGLTFLASIVLIAVYTLRNGRLPVVFGIDMMAGPFSERFGVYGAIKAALPWAVVNVLEMLAGYWIWKSRKRGGVLALVLLPLGAIFWIGYALPVMVLIGPLRVLLVAKGWKTLR